LRACGFSNFSGGFTSLRKCPKHLGFGVVDGMVADLIGS